MGLCVICCTENKEKTWEELQLGDCVWWAGRTWIIYSFGDKHRWVAALNTLVKRELPEGAPWTAWEKR